MDSLLVKDKNSLSVSGKTMTGSIFFYSDTSSPPKVKPSSIKANILGL